MKLTFLLMFVSCCAFSQQNRSSNVRPVPVVRNVVIIGVPYDLTCAKVRKPHFSSDTIYVRQTRKEFKKQQDSIKLIGLDSIKKIIENGKQ